MRSQTYGSRANHRAWLVEAARRRFALLAAVAITWMAAVPTPAEGRPPTDWSAIRKSVVEMQVQRPGAIPSRAYGFALEGVAGIVTCRHFVRGAERVLIRLQDGDILETTDFVASDSAHDLIVLESPRRVPALTRATHLMLAPRQFGLVPLPPAVEQDTYKMAYLSEIECEGPGVLLACWGNISPGLPFADSLGRAVAVIEILEMGSDKVAFGIPIERVYEMMSRPDAGGSLASLASTPDAPWTDPTSAAGSQIMGAVLARANQLDRAFPYLTRAVELNPNHPGPLLEWGMAFHLQKEHAAADAYFADALKLGAQNPLTQLYLGSSYFQQGKNEQAIAAFQAAMDADPEWALPLVNLGGLYYQQGKAGEAEALMRRALALEPQMGLAHYNLGMMCFSDGRSGQGKEILDLLRAEGSGFASMLDAKARKEAAR